MSHRKHPVRLTHVAKVGLPDPPGPAGARPIDLVVAGERLPHLRAHCLQGSHQRRQRAAALLRGKSVRICQIQGLARCHAAQRSTPVP